MAGTVYEWYSYLATDKSQAAESAAERGVCAFVPGRCKKKGGACAVQPADEPIIVCPKRLYGDDHMMLREIAADAFGAFDVRLDIDGLPCLVPGDIAYDTAVEYGVSQVGVFGNGFAGEVKLPAAIPGGARYSVDFTLVVVSVDGDLLAFVPVEVQTIDTTGSYRASLTKLIESRSIVGSRFGMNWENVNKRILPQLIVKGLMLQGERLCTTGIYFVTPEPVFKRIMLRLGGVNRLRRIPKQPGSITFIRYQHADESTPPGTLAQLVTLEELTVSTSDMSLAFISPENLPAIGAFETSIRARL